MLTYCFVGCIIYLQIAILILGLMIFSAGSFAIAALATMNSQYLEEIKKLHPELQKFIQSIQDQTVLFYLKR